MNGAVPLHPLVRALLVRAILVPALLAACQADPMGAPDGSVVTVSGEGVGTVELSQVISAEGAGYLRQFDAMVTSDPDADDGGLAMNDIQVEILSSWNGAYVVSEGAVQTVDDFEERCSDQEDEGGMDAECAVWFDVSAEEYVEFAGEYANVDEFRPTYMSGATDHRGIMSFFVFVDSIPFDEEGVVLPFSIFATIGVDDDSFTMDVGD